MTHLPEEAQNALDRWLSIATEDLSDAVKANIRRAIEAYYGQILLSLIVKGMDAEPAQQEALSRLGPPEDAAAYYRSIHPSASLEEILHLKPERDLHKHPYLWIPQIQTNGLTWISPWAKYSPLTAWLIAATQDLARYAQERIETEIRSHYEEALACAIEDGKSEPEAQAEALAALGDADKANQSFRNVYLTEDEFNLLNGGPKYFESQKKKRLKQRIILAVQSGLIIYYLIFSPHWIVFLLAVSVVLSIMAEITRSRSIRLLREKCFKASMRIHEIYRIVNKLDAYFLFLFGLYLLLSLFFSREIWYPFLYFITNFFADNFDAYSGLMLKLRQNRLPGGSLPPGGPGGPSGEPGKC